MFIFCVGGRRRVVLACEAVFARETCWEAFCRLFVFWVSGRKRRRRRERRRRRRRTTQTENGIDGNPPPASPCPCPLPPRLWARRRARASGTAAPRGVEVHEHGHGRSLDHVVERRVRFLRRVSHARIPRRVEIVRYFQSAGAGTAEARVRRPRFAARTGALGTTERAEGRHRDGKRAGASLSRARWDGGARGEVSHGFRHSYEITKLSQRRSG